MKGYIIGGVLGMLCALCVMLSWDIGNGLGSALVDMLLLYFGFGAGASLGFTFEGVYHKYKWGRMLKRRKGDE